MGSKYFGVSFQGNGLQIRAGDIGTMLPNGLLLVQDRLKEMIKVREKKPDLETARVLQDFVRGTKSRAQWLSGGVEFLNQIPKSSSGKILRRVLRDRDEARSKPSALPARL